MNNKQFPEYEVMPDITFTKDTVYRVVRVQTRNEDGTIAAFEKVDESHDPDEAERMTQRLNSQGKKG